MRKLLNKPWFVALLATGAIGAVVWQVLPHRPAGFASGTPAADTPADDGTTDGSATPTASSPERVQSALKQIATIKAVRDPFAARIRNAVTAVVEKAEPDLVESVRVSAVWIQGPSTFVLINDRICQAGDHLGRLTVESVTRDGVWLRHWKGRDFVAIGNGFTLTTPARQAVALLSSEG